MEGAQLMPRRTDIKKIMVIGSGPIIIGQAAEFDYAGTQACLALREEGYEVVLVNSNPATIMTDKEVADKVYIEPITFEFVARILRKEKPDALLPTLGGQTGLNMAMELAQSGILKELKDWRYNKIYNLINTIALEKIPLIITTNNALDELDTDENKRISDRLSAICKGELIDFPSRRQGIANKKFNLLMSELK